MADNRIDWLRARKGGIGASEAACVLGLSPYKSNVELWEEKTGRREAPELSGNPRVDYGKRAEQHLRRLFELDYPEYLVEYDEFGMVANLPDQPWLFATLDGALTHRENQRRGVLEIKTVEISRPQQWEEWNDGVPQHYYIQVLHQLLATGYDFAVLKAQIKYRKDGELNLSTRHYFFERCCLKDDLYYLLQAETTFWACVLDDRRPALILPEI